MCDGFGGTVVVARDDGHRGGTGAGSSGYSGSGAHGSGVSGGDNIVASASNGGKATSHRCELWHHRRRCDSGNSGEHQFGHWRHGHVANFQRRDPDHNSPGNAPFRERRAGALHAERNSDDVTAWTAGAATEHDDDHDASGTDLAAFDQAFGHPRNRCLLWVRDRGPEPGNDDHQFRYQHGHGVLPSRVPLTALDTMRSRSTAAWQRGSNRSSRNNLYDQWINTTTDAPGYLALGGDNQSNNGAVDAITINVTQTQAQALQSLVASAEAAAESRTLLCNTFGDAHAQNCAEWTSMTLAGAGVGNYGVNDMLPAQFFASFVVGEIWNNTSNVVSLDRVRRSPRQTDLSWREIAARAIGAAVFLGTPVLGSSTLSAKEATAMSVCQSDTTPITAADVIAACTSIIEARKASRRRDRGRL